MSNYAIKAPKRRWPLLLAIIVIVIALLGGGAVLFVRRAYDQNLKPVNANQKRVTITIPLDSSLQEIAAILKKHDLIRSDWAFERYVRNAGLADKMQAGTYALQSSQSVKDIVSVLTNGDILKDLFTVLPGQRLDQIKQAFLSYGYDEAVVDKALDPDTYPDHPALTDKPTSASLEGYLYPESFQKTSQTTAEEIVRKSLDQMHQRLTPAVRDGLIAQNLTVHQGVILASVIEQEVSKESDRPIVAQVFLKRLRDGVRLESDATAPYGAILAGKDPESRFDSAYNTYTYDGLPPTPISNVSQSSLNAVANPSSTDWLYFVSGDDGVTYFSKTLAEHQALTAAHCNKLCGN